MLTLDERQQLELLLEIYEKKRGSQIAVLLVDSTAPEAIEQYSIRVADTWKLGRKGIDDGVLLLIAKDNPSALRRLRIEAGRGVQGVLTDAQSKRILEDTIAPHFHQRDGYNGLVAGVFAIETLLDQEKFPPLRRLATSPNVGYILLAVVALITIGNIFLPRTGPGSRISRRRPARPGRRAQQDTNWIDSPPAFALDSVSFDEVGGSPDGSDVSGDGGTFDGGGASGDWDD
jgi:uncharacterized protein